jgi:hypothetical protein
MGTELVKPEDFAVVQSDPAELQALIKETLGGESLQAHDLDRVKVPSGGALSWEVPTVSGEASMKELVGIIVHHQNKRAYWHEKFSGGNEKPDCSSEDAITGVGDPGGECASCPFAQFGSDEDGVSQACKALKHIFILTEGSVLPIVVTLPPSSLAPAKKYLMRLIQNRIAPSGIVTKLTLEKAESKGGIKYSKAVFAAGEPLKPDDAEKVKQYAEALKPSLRTVNIDPQEL